MAKTKQSNEGNAGAPTPVGEPPVVAEGSGLLPIAGAHAALAIGTSPGQEPRVRPADLDSLEEAAIAHALAHSVRQHIPEKMVAVAKSFERALRSMYISFQPIVWARDLSVFGYEALLRPNDPVILHPGAMFEAAERLGRLEQLGRTIRLRVAEAFATARPEHGFIFVNLHAADLADKALVSQFAPLTAIAPRVVLEITEQNSLEEYGDVGARVEELRGLGFRIAIDDLGAGHSRMNVVSPSVTDFVKLDMSLVRGIQSSNEAQELVASITSSCHEHEIRVIGEGVECEAEARTLIRLGCDLLQGFLIARPGPSLP